MVAWYFIGGYRRSGIYSVRDSEVEDSVFLSLSAPRPATYSPLRRTRVGRKYRHYIYIKLGKTIDLQERA